MRSNFRGVDCHYRKLSQAMNGHLLLRVKSAVAQVSAELAGFEPESPLLETDLPAG